MFRRIRDLRIDHDLTQKNIADALGMHVTQYQVYERGEVKIPIDFFIDLARYYNVSIDYLAGLANTPRTLNGEPYKISPKYSIDQNGCIISHIIRREDDAKK